MRLEQQRFILDDLAAVAASASTLTDARAARPLRVALVTGSYNYIKDGVALTLNRLVEYLEGHGVEVLVLATVSARSAFPHKGTLFPVPSVPVPRRADYRVSLGFSKAARQRLRDFQPDLIHVATPDIAGNQALKLGLQWKIPVVASYHTHFETYLKFYGVGFLNPLLNRYLHRFYRRCTELYVPSASMADVLRARGLRNNIRLWTRGVDAERFAPAKRSPEWRKRHGIGDGEAVIVFVSRLVREKRLDTLVATLQELRRRQIPHRALIVGEGPERQWIARQLPDAVFTGFLECGALAHAYASSDIFLFPSDTETFGNVTLEAMASGLPAVCADAPGSRSLVLPDVTGFLAQPNQAAAFVEPLVRLVRDQDLRRRMASAARARSLDFTWDAANGRLLGYYQALVRSRSPVDK